MAEATKDTIYIDVDDEITAIIEKVRESKHKIVALVLPKRTTTLQSIVNMKLLKRTAQAEKKQLVLITSETSLLPLAGAVGVHVARSLQSKPAIPDPPETPKQTEAVVDEDDENEVDKNKSVGELAGLSGASVADKAASPEETIDIDNADEAAKTKDGKKAKGKSKVKVPNFDKFRVRLFLIIGGVILFIIFLIFATKVWPKATVTIKTNAVDVNTNFGFTADTAAKTFDAAKGIVPASVKDETITNSQKVSATGKKNLGNTATGSVSFTATACAPNLGTPTTVPAGTTVNANNAAFATQGDATFSFTGFSGGSCANYASNAVNITAQSPGPQANVPSGTSFSVSGRSGVSGSGTASGGTDNNVTVVQQSDIDGAVEKLTQNTDKAKSDLSKQFSDAHLFALAASITAGKPTVTTDNKVGDQASDVTVSAQIDFTMLGVNRDDLKKLVINAAKSQIDVTKQAISDDGLDKATFSVNTHDSANKQELSVQTTATAGAQIDQASIKQQIAGKKSGDVQQLIQGQPSVQTVTVKFSPFWVNQVPKNPKKITIIVQKDQATNHGNSSQ